VSAEPLDFQVAVDAERPHELAAWWAAALGWEVEPTSEEFIRKMIAEGHATEEDTMEFCGALAWKAGAAIRHPAGKDSGRPRVLFQPVPDRARTSSRRLSRRSATPRTRAGYSSSTC
jgi:hypothetical protein